MHEPTAVVVGISDVAALGVDCSTHDCTNGQHWKKRCASFTNPFCIPHEIKALGLLFCT